MVVPSIMETAFLRYYADTALHHQDAGEVNDLCTDLEHIAQVLNIVDEKTPKELVGLAAAAYIEGSVICQVALHRSLERLSKGDYRIF
ncbi:hypothetical protein HOI26_02260 [Candidatus Woesearchaeota archaeon]|jgi:hypothetical protein|nr:hypothetical protein [Candidatus Woesearchaeota archaeon]MBT5739901.1 hypothetical protein [Candidatus Woesearchaeota archaeon]